MAVRVGAIVGDDVLQPLSHARPEVIRETIPQFGHYMLSIVLDPEVHMPDA